MRSRMSSVRTFLIVLATLFLIAEGCTGHQQGTTSSQPASSLGFVPDTKPAPAAHWADATLPVGTEMQVTLLDRLNSRSNRIGDRFIAQVAEAVVVGDTVVVPAGSTLNGVVGAGKAGSLALAFKEIVTPTGATAGIKARVAGASGSVGS